MNLNSQDEPLGYLDTNCTFTRQEMFVFIKAAVIDGSKRDTCKCYVAQKQ